MNKKSNIPLTLKVIRWLFPKLEKFAPALSNQYFIKIFFSPLHYAVPEKEKKAESFAEKFEVQASGKKIQCYTWGEGDKVILVAHGWAGRATQFRRFIKPLNAAGFKVVGFDGPAHGASEGKKTTILEFEETLKAIYKKVGEPEAIIAHSFGGSAVLFSAMQGLPVKKLINISSPTIGDEVVNTFLRAVNGSGRTKNYFKTYMIKTYGHSFDYFSSLNTIQHLPTPVKLLLVHDEKDKEVTIEHAFQLMKLYPQATLYKTSGLGHTRILKDDNVIKFCVTYILQYSS